MKQFYIGIKGIIKDPTRGVLILLHNDFWDIPGGRIDDDELFEQTLTRELTEELPGTVVHQISIVQGAYRVPKNIDGDTGLVLLYFLVDATLPEKIVLSDEHNDYKWITTVADIPDSVNGEVRRIIIDILK